MLDTTPSSLAPTSPVLPAAPANAHPPSAPAVATVGPADPAASTAPDHERTRTAALVATACVAVAVALYLGREFFAPLAVAIVLSILLNPVVRALGRLGLPAPVGATVVILGLLGVTAGAAALLAQPVRDWVAAAPARFQEAEQKLRRLPQPLSRVADAIGTSGSATMRSQNQTPQGIQQGSRPSSAQSGNDGFSSATPDSVAPDSGAAKAAFAFLGATSQAVGAVVEVLVLLLLLLASEGRFFRNFLAVLPGPHGREAATGAADESRGVVMQYLLVNALINAGQGVVVALVLWWLKMPAPVLWGVFTFALEFIPYLGAVVMIGLLAVVSLATFDSLGHALLAPGSYLVITTLQNNLVSPVAYGRRLRLNAVAVFVGVMFWWFLLGVPGAFLAVPILATARIAAEHSKSLRPLAVLLGD